MTVRDQLAEYCAGLKYEEVPLAIIEYTRRLIMDQIGLTASGSRINPEMEHQGIIRFFLDMGGTRESSLVTQGRKVPCLNAVFCNTALSFGGFDGMHRSALHLTSSLIPAAIAVAERQHSSGKDLILAVLAGSEVMGRVGLALNAGATYDRGFHPTSLCAPFGCAVAAARLLGLGKEATAEAISIAGVQGAGARPWPQFPKHADTGSLQVGKGAQSGVLSAFLARMGTAGINDILENKVGFLYSHSPNPDPSRLTEGLGSIYEITQTTVKWFGMGIYNIPAVEALIHLVKQHKLDARGIDRIICKLPTAVVPLVGAPGYPSTAPNLSCRYLLVFAAYHGEEGMVFNRRYKSQANLNDPRHIELFARTDIIAGPELDKYFPGKWPSVVTVKMKDGREFSHFHDGSVKGSPENPLSADDIERRFTEMVAPVAGKRKCSRMMKILRGLEGVTDVSEVAVLMAAKPQSGKNKI